jgi:4-amino-4-deoxy-L-arabinose transferase-like glycosyltransferase
LLSLSGVERLLDYPPREARAAMGKGATRDSTDRLDAGLLALLVVGGAAVRVALMGEPMRYDESFTFFAYAMTPIGHITSTYDFPNNHVLYTLLTHFAWLVLGDHVWVVRLPALAAGLALIPSAYLAARALYGRSAGLVAAGLVTGLAPLIDYSVDGRGYMLGTLLIVVSLWLAARR